LIVIRHIHIESMTWLPEHRSVISSPSGQLASIAFPGKQLLERQAEPNMSFDPLTAVNGAIPNMAPLPGSAAPTTGDATGAFSRAVANASSEASNVATSHASARAQESRREATRVAEVREYHLTSLPRNPQDGMGHHVLDRLETIYRGDQRLRTASAPATDSPPVALAGAGLPRGPAAGPLNGAARSADPFAVMLRNFEQVYQQSIQVGLMTKSTGAFTTSMNKLMSSA
jgi:hypothetical protein